jgi:tetratricopeptide (TPR) repeat protein
MAASSVGIMAAETAPALSPREVAERASGAVVLIEAEVGSITSQGSGFLVDDGTIITCLHVIEGASSLVVSLRDGTRLEDVAIRSFDVERDLTVLVVDLPTGNAARAIVEFGDTTSIEPGSQILVISNPLGLEHTVTEGIVSAWREPSEEGLQVRLLQISATISPGSSGGPVLNDRAEVIGVATSGVLWGTAGLNFAVPVDELPALLEQDDGMDLETFGERVDDIRREMAEPYFEDGRLAYQRGDVEESSRHLERALQLFPRYADALLLSGKIAIEQGQVDLAEQRLTLATEVDEYNVDAWYHLGETHQLKALASGELVDAARAEAAFETVLEIDGRHGKASFGLALIRIARGEFDQAEQLLTSAVDNEPGLTDAYYVLGEIYLGSDRTTEAQAAFEQALWEDDSHALSHFGLARVYMRLDASPFGAISSQGNASEHWEEFLRLSEDDPSLAEQREAALVVIKQYFPHLLD